MRNGLSTESDEGMDSAGGASVAEGMAICGMRVDGLIL